MESIIVVDVVVELSGGGGDWHPVARACVACFITGSVVLESLKKKCTHTAACSDILLSPMVACQAMLMVLSMYILEHEVFTTQSTMKQGG